MSVGLPDIWRPTVAVAASFNNFARFRIAASDIREIQEAEQAVIIVVPSRRIK
jgi:hypothetical protein